MVCVKSMAKKEDQDCIDQSPSVKCLVFSAALAGGYWFLPAKNKWILLALLYFPYLILAWYDYYYQCQRNLGPTYLALFYKDLKPKDSDQIQTYENWCPKWKKRVWIIDMIVMVFLSILAVPFWYWTP